MCDIDTDYDGGYPVPVFVLPDFKTDVTSPFGEVRED